MFCTTSAKYNGIIYFVISVKFKEKMHFEQTPITAYVIFTLLINDLFFTLFSQERNEKSFKNRDGPLSTVAVLSS